MKVEWMDDKLVVELVGCWDVMWVVVKDSETVATTVER